MAIPSFYFTLFKKFQVLGHVPAGTNHGAGVGGFNLNQPAAIFGSSGTGTLLGTSNNPADSPLWAVLNSRAMGNDPFTPVNVGGNSWPTMPAGTPASWTEFQVSAPAPKLVDVFGDWISAGKVNDIPTGVLGQVPPPIQKPRGGLTLFVCNLSGDDGTQPIPDNYWATSLIFLVDPMTGSIVNPSQLAATKEYYLTAIVGNRGATGGGRYLAGGGTKIECEAWVMVWNTGFSPAVRLPALANLDLGEKQPIYEVYFLKPGTYEVVGFRLPVQTVFDGLVKAIEDAAVDLGGLTAEEWIHSKNAHLCAKVMIRHADQGWPAPSDTPLQTRRVAQKNLAPFRVDLTVDEPDPNIEWTHFMLGEAARSLGPDRRAGWHFLSIQDRTRGEPLGLYLAIPRKSFATMVDAGRIRGFKILENGPTSPMPDAVLLKRVAKRNRIPIRPLGDRRFLAASLGIEYRRSTIKPGLLGVIEVIQRTAAPVLDLKNYSYRIETPIAGGFTLELQATKKGTGTRD
ncbi:MAG TPA: hypothetical protein PLX89_11560 [Verrucomicrobiota bacterium]|nr:hypothetical protein [Verrucomicrobiales bacterium]HRI13628.1 hypothetical protein [Verrucomicrobiota bacterium]